MNQHGLVLVEGLTGCGKGDGADDGAVTLAFVGDTVPQPWRRRHVRVPHDRVADLGKIAIPVGGAVHGRVVDEHATPVPGVMVLHDHRPAHLLAYLSWLMLR